ncbi:zinc finger protein [Anopheles sinensis]|uniref:Zinc finger protein n=1 Tax=Anopheles sinensis TaxID=74873 RepID=A0A084VUI9_ANOSI|nr:zinc finger protein [Anopheles sinensis]
MYCRLCLERAEEVQRLDEVLFGPVTIREAIETTIGITTEVGSIVPTNVCSICTVKLKFTLAFRMGCLESDRQMQQALAELNFPHHEALIGEEDCELANTFTEVLKRLKVLPVDHENATLESGYDILESETFDVVTEHCGENESIEECLDTEGDHFKPTQLLHASTAMEKQPNGKDLEPAEDSLQDDTGDDSEYANGTATISNPIRPRVDEYREAPRIPETKPLDDSIAATCTVSNENNGESQTSGENTVNNHDQLDTNIYDILDGKILTPLEENTSEKDVQPVKAKQRKEYTRHGKSKKIVNSQSNGRSKKSSSADTTNDTQSNAVDVVELVAHTCYYCSETFETARDFEVHLSTHIKLLPFTCPDCHTAEYPMVCRTLVSMNRHLQSHLYPYRCPNCPKRFLKQRSADIHIAQEHTEETNPDGHKCERCGASFKRAHLLQRHQRAHEAEDTGRFRCEYCKRAFGTGTCLRRHRRIHTGEKPYACEFCGKRFNHEHNFTNHKRLHLGERIHTCEVCQRSYTTGTALRIHMADHFPDDPRYGRRQNRRPAAKKHYPETLREFSLQGVEITHTADGQREYRCAMEADCQYTTVDYHRIIYHRQWHAKEFECDRCGKQFTVRAKLSAHIETVHENRRTERPRNHLCSHCGKAFSTTHRLQQHVDVHLGNKHYQCRECGKEFVQKSNWKVHQLVHTKEKPFSCGVCMKLFGTASGLRLHLRRHKEPDGGAPPTPQKSAAVTTLEIEETID